MRNGKPVLKTTPSVGLRHPFHEHRGTALSHYNGIGIFISKGAHQACADLCRQHCPPPARALDIAAGEGAFASRLLDMGYEVAANDLDSSGWKETRIVPSAIDLNGDFSRLLPSPFGLVVAIAVIEHLENPLHFLRECRNLVRTDGHLLLVLPNVTDYDSRYKLLCKGVLHQYSPDHAAQLRHISILPSWLAEDHFNRVGFRVAAKQYVGCKDYAGYGWRKWPHLLATRILSALPNCSPEELSHNNVAYMLTRVGG